MEHLVIHIVSWKQKPNGFQIQGLRNKNMYHNMNVNTSTVSVKLDLPLIFIIIGLCPLHANLKVLRKKWGSRLQGLPVMKIEYRVGISFIPHI